MEADTVVSNYIPPIECCSILAQTRGSQQYTRLQSNKYIISELAIYHLNHVPHWKCVKQEHL